MSLVLIEKPGRSFASTGWSEWKEESEKNNSSVSEVYEIKFPLMYPVDKQTVQTTVLLYFIIKSFSFILYFMTPFPKNRSHAFHTAVMFH